jgi:hypothetical protein
VSPDELLKAIIDAETTSVASAAVERFTMANPVAKWSPVGGRSNNRGIVEVSSNPGRAVVERVTNAIDAVLDAEHDKHDGKPDCQSPRQAASAWLNVPEDGLSAMAQAARQALAKRVVVRLSPGDGPDKRVIEVIDRGTGLSAEDMPTTILSLNESNKVQKPYLAGTYGQGGSATFASSDLSLIASRVSASNEVSFTVVRFEPPPADAIKGGSYVYLTVGGKVLTATVSNALQDPGTRCIHFGYDLTKFTSPIGPSSVYGLLQQVMFHPVLPIWFDNRVHDWRRVIKGSRNALSGAVDEGDSNGPNLAHSTPMFYISLGDYGRAGIEYWLLEKPEKKNKRPTQAFVDPAKPIVLTLNGQNQDEMTVRVIRKEAELPFLTQRLICHIDCNSLTPAALRNLFSSNREGARRGAVYEMLEKALVGALRSDDELKRLNAEARDAQHRDEDKDVSERMRKEVAKLLRIQGFEVSTTTGAVAGGPDLDPRPSPRPRPPRPIPNPIELREPPTFIRILWPEGESIGLYPGQRRYIRIETDAHSSHHDPKDPNKSHVNVVVAGMALQSSGSTALQGGRMRVIVGCVDDAAKGGTGRLQVELRVPGQPTLSDARDIAVVEPPKATGAKQEIAMPPFNVLPVEGPDDQMWESLGWPEAINTIASQAVTTEGKLTVYYSKVFPHYAEYTRKLEAQDPSLAESFDARYRTWLAVHSLILDKEMSEQASSETPSGGETVPEGDRVDEIERAERCRFATIAAMFAAQEIKRSVPPDEE